MNAQNLIRNGSFEDLVQCPSTAGQLNLASPWFNPNKASPDLFNTCSGLSYFSGVPSNYAGYQLPHSGLGYANICCSKFPNGMLYYEYLSVPIYGIVKGKSYKLEFYLSLADSSDSFTNEVSVLLSESKLDSQVYNYISLSPTATTCCNWLDESDGWQKIEILFSGAEAMNYLTIGFFEDFDQMQKVTLTGRSAKLIAYYIDEVVLFPIDYFENLYSSEVCIREPLIVNLPYYEDMIYAWYYDGVQISDSCCPVINNPSAGWYYLEYTDFRGDTYRDSMYVSLKNCAEESILDEPGVFQEQEQEHFLILPTWFAPSQSQYWHPQWRDLEYWEVTVYNSLGQIVHRYTGLPELHPGWDGFSMAAGVYCAVVNARAYNGEQLRVVEKVMLLR